MQRSGALGAGVPQDTPQHQAAVGLPAYTPALGEPLGQLQPRSWFALVVGVGHGRVGSAAVDGEEQPTCAQLQPQLDSFQVAALGEDGVDGELTSQPAGGLGQLPQLPAPTHLADEPSRRGKASSVVTRPSRSRRNGGRERAWASAWSTVS